MASNEDIIREAEYYLNNDVTIEQASSDLGVSKRTLQLHLKKLESIAPETFKLVTEKKAANERRGKVLGGTLGKRGPSWTEEQAAAYARMMIEQGLTFQEAEKFTGIPHTTLHEMVTKANLDPKNKSLMYALAEANKRGMDMNQYIEKHYQKHVVSDIVAKEIKEEKANKGK